MFICGCRDAEACMIVVQIGDAELEMVKFVWERVRKDGKEDKSMCVTL